MLRQHSKVMDLLRIILQVEHLVRCIMAVAHVLEMTLADHRLCRLCMQETILFNGWFSIGLKTA
jgi:hypothetical protein